MGCNINIKDLINYSKFYNFKTCANEALIRCFGGKLTGINGIEYDYVFEEDPK